MVIKHSLSEKLIGLFGSEIWENMVFDPTFFEIWVTTFELEKVPELEKASEFE